MMVIESPTQKPCSPKLFLAYLGLAVAVFLLPWTERQVCSQDELLGRKPSLAATKVERVLSVDRIQVEGGIKVRLIGLKGPPAPRRKRVETDEHGFIIEKFDPGQSVEEKAFGFVKDLLEGKTVRLEYDVKQKDADFDTLAYVFVVPENIFVNQEILRQGFAQLQILPPNTKHENDLRQAYLEARQDMRGLHGE